MRRDPRVALTIDANEFPHSVLLVRGIARVEEYEGMTPEYEACAGRYCREQMGEAWVTNMRKTLPSMGRIVIEPNWVSILDFQKRFPSALSA